jgi:hypothetical protein
MEATKARKKKTERKAQRDMGQHQTDLAEGELETVEESIRIHEKKHDIEGRTPNPKEKQDES